VISSLVGKTDYYFPCEVIRYIVTGNGSFNRPRLGRLRDDGRFVTGHGGVLFRHESARRCFLTQALRFEKFQVKNTDREIEKTRVIAVTCKKLGTCFFFLDNFFRVFHRRISTYSGKGIDDIGVYTKAKASGGGGSKNKQNSQNSSRIQFLHRV